MTKVMIVDDDESIRKSIVRVLEMNGYQTCVAQDGETAIDSMLSEQPDIVILDIMLPHTNGYIVCGQLREIRETLPVIFLSAKGDIVDKTTGFKSGADDYVTKPFDVDELLLRIEAVLRRVNPRPIGIDTERIDLGDVVIFPKSYSVSIKGKQVDLTAREFEILCTMASYPGQVFSRRRIYEAVWGEANLGDDGVVAVYIRRIREKIEVEPKQPQHLLTVWGVGYKLV